MAGYLLEEQVGHFTSSSLTSSSFTSSSELCPQKLHPGLCQGPKDATPSSRLLPTLGHTTHSAHSIHASRVCKEGPALVPATTQQGHHRLDSSLPVGKAGAPADPLCFGVFHRHPSASSPFLSESLPVRACSPKNRAHRKTCTDGDHSSNPCPRVPLLTPGWLPQELLGLPAPPDTEGTQSVPPTGGP